MEGKEVNMVAPDFGCLIKTKKHNCKVAREVVGGPRGPIVIIVEVIQCKVD